jgi:hypothetical protein
LVALVLFFDFVLSTGVSISVVAAVAVAVAVVAGMTGDSSLIGVATSKGVAAPDTVGVAALLAAGLLCMFHKFVTDLFIALSSCAGFLEEMLVFIIEPGGKYSVNHDCGVSLTKAYSAEASSSADSILLKIKSQ